MLENENIMGAKVYMSEKSGLQEDLEKILSAISVMKTQQRNIESYNMDQGLLFVLKNGSEQVKKLGKKTEMDEVENAVSEIYEQLQDTSERKSVFMQPMDTHNFDEELNEMRAKKISTKLLETKTPVTTLITTPSLKNAHNPQVPYQRDMVKRDLIAEAAYKL